MTWRYVVSKEYAGTDVVYGIREYYHPSTGLGTGWTENTVKPQGDTYEELLRDLHHMLDDALEGSILDLTINPPALVPKEEHNEQV